MTRNMTHKSFLRNNTAPSTEKGGTANQSAWKGKPAKNRQRPNNEQTSREGVCEAQIFRERARIEENHRGFHRMAVESPAQNDDDDDLLRRVEQAGRIIKIFVPNFKSPLLQSKEALELFHRFACRREETKIETLISEYKLSDVRHSPLTQLAKRHISKINIRVAHHYERLESSYIVLDYNAVLFLEEDARYGQFSMAVGQRNLMMRDHFDPKWARARTIPELKAFRL